MDEQNESFKFEFSLEVLNHLGRGLYRSFATVIAEAVSNSWDAEATKVYITIGKDKLTVEDNGKGMNAEDFQGKFLRVGYSRRTDPSNRSKRKIIGRKGIGKLAMLSISEKVTIFSKKEGFEITGGKIDNPELDKKIKKDKSYDLGNLTAKDIKDELNDKLEHGTKIIFEKFKTRLNNEDIIRKYLATQFNFVFSLEGDDSFEIIVNKKEVGENDLKELNDNTQFLWFLEEDDESIKNRFINLANDKVVNSTSFDFNGEKIEVKGYIASVKTSSNLLLKGSKGDFKAGINLFTNGRLRQENLFDEITTKALAEEYLYGEIHVDGFEDEKNDRFTSSREGIIKDDPLYRKFLEELRKIQKIIIQDWTPLRVALRQDGDLRNDKRPEYVVRLEQSKNRRQKDFEKKIDEEIEDEEIKKKLQNKIRSLSGKNTQIYQDLFTLENIFREYIKIKGIEECNFDNSIPEEKDVLDSMKNIRSLRKKGELAHALEGKIVESEHYLNYMDLYYLSEVVDIMITKIAKTPKKYRVGMIMSAKEIEPVRNPVMHTNEIADSVLEWDKIKNLINHINKLSDKK